MYLSVFLGESKNFGRDISSPNSSEIKDLFTKFYYPSIKVC